MMQLPVFRRPEVWSFTPNCIMESAENLFIVLFCHCLSFRCILVMHNFTHIKEYSVALILLPTCRAYCAAIFESVEPLLNLCYPYNMVYKHLLNLTNCFALRITKFFIKFDTVSLLSSFSHRERNKKSDEHVQQPLTRRPDGSDWHTRTRKNNSGKHIKLSPSTVRIGTALSSLL